MEIRRITEQDVPSLRTLLAVAFEFGWETEAPDFLQPPPGPPKDHRERDWKNRFVAVKNGEILSSMASYDYTVRFDGGQVGMGGIGDVATFPQHRGHGAVRECMKAVLAFSRERGQALSYLYPFSTGFYGKFGYGHGCTKTCWEIPIAALPQIKYTGRFTLYGQGETTAPFVQIYDAFAAGRNLSVVREEIDWAPFAARNGLQHKEYTYLYQKEDGQPGGYFTMHPEQEQEKTFMNVRDFLFDSRGTLEAMLSFLVGFAANYDVVRLWLPEETDLSLVLTELVRVRQENCFWGMARVVDVEQIFRKAAYLDDGTAVIRVIDTMCPWNDKTFQLDFTRQGANVQETDKTPDVTLPVSRFSELILGRYAPEQFMYFGEFDQAKNRKNLEKIFYKKNIWIQDGF